MIIQRREFLKMLGAAGGAAGLGGCRRSWSLPDRLVELALRGPGLETHAQTICGLCEGGCGLTVRLVDGLPVGLAGNPRHPLNQGGLCPVGLAGLEILYAPERLQAPLRREDDAGHRATTWDEALGEIAARLAALRDANRGHRVALLSGEPSRLFHDLAEKFTAALGSASLGRISDAAVLGYRLTQGIDEPPAYDLAHSDLVLSFGLDLFEDGPAPLHATSSLVGSRAIEERASTIHVGTRLSPSAAKAETYVPVRPGTFGAFALGVAHTLVREGNHDRRFLAEHTLGFEDWTDDGGRRRLGFRRLLMERYYPDRVARLCGCEPALIARTARRFAAAEAAVAVAGGEAIQGTNATWTVMAVHALNALVGAFDRPGGVVLPPPVPLSPMPESPDSAHGEGRSEFSSAGSPGILGADPVERLAEGVLGGTHPVEMLIVIGANPVHASPLGGRLREAMARIPMVVVSSSFLDETAAAADFVLPAPVYLESWQGATTPPSVALSTLGVAQPVVEPLGDTRHPADVLLDLARRAGPAVGAALPWADHAAYLKYRLEGLAASGQGSVVSGSFEDSWVQFLEERGWRFLGRQAVDGLWNDLLRESAWWNPVRQRGDWARLFPTPSGRFEFFSHDIEKRLVNVGTAGERGTPSSDEEALARGIALLGSETGGDEICLPHHEPPRENGSGDLTLLPFRPITARGDLGVTSPMVLEMFGYPTFSAWQTWAELAPETARELALGDGDEVEVESDAGSLEAIVRVQPGATPGTVHLPVGLGHRESFGEAGGVGANPLAIVLSAADPLSGRPSLTTTRVRLRLVRRRRHGGPAPGHGDLAG